MSTCEACDTELSPNAKFCSECGRPTGIATPPAPSGPVAYSSHAPPDLREKAHNPVGLLGDERKQVTVLFADLAGSVELVADRDPEEARTLLSAVVGRMVEAVYRFEGTIARVIGDGIMALFGAPLALEDHAFRACGAALAMQDAIHAYSAERQRSHGTPVHIRVGLDSGEVVVGDFGSDLHAEYSAIGHTANMASRMEQLAPQGGVYLTHSTARLVEGLAQVRAVGPVSVKGLREPIEAFSLVGIGSGASRPLQTFGPHGLSQFVGRQPELAELRRAMEETAQGRGQIVALVGEAGVGKSRLFIELSHAYDFHDWLILESGRVALGDVTSYQPIVGLLKLYFEITDEDDANQRRTKIHRKLQRHPALQATSPAFHALLDSPVEDSQWQALEPRQRSKKTLDAVLQLVLNESAVRPLCLVFEDLQRIDPETQTFLDSLVDSLPDHRVLLLVNYRPEYQHPWTGKTAFTQLRIDPLAPPHAVQLLHSVIGKHGQLSALVDFLIERTDGNPLFLEESIQALLETGVLTGEPGAYRLVKPVQSISVPPTVEAILAARIDRLPIEDKRVLQTAAVLGKDVPFGVLKSITEGPELDLRNSLSRLQAMEFLKETRTSPEPEYRFKHALTHEVAYGSLLNQRRKELDAAIVAGIEIVYSRQLSDQTASLAHHAFRGELWDKAALYLQQAGTRAVSRSAYGEAKTHFERALTAFSHLPETEKNLTDAIQIRVELGPVLIATKGSGAVEVESLYNEARALCERIGETPKLFPILWGLARLHVRRGDLKSGQQVGEQLLSVAQYVRDPALLLEAHHTLWATLFSLGELEPTRAHLEHGFSLYDPRKHGHHAGLYGGHDPGVCCDSHAARVLWLLGYPDQAAEHAENAINSAGRLSHPYTLASALHNAIWTHQHRGDRATIQKQSEALWQLASAQGFPASIANATVVRGWLLTQDGHGEEGIARMRQRWDSLGRTRYHFAALLAEACGNEGQLKEGLSEIDQALLTVTKTGERFYEPELHRIKGELLLKENHADEQQASDCFRTSIRVAREQSSKSFELRATTSLSRLLLNQGERNEPRQMLEQIYGWYTEGFNTADLKQAKALLEELS